MGFSGLPAALLLSIFVVITIGIFTMTLDSMRETGTPGVPAVPAIPQDCSQTDDQPSLRNSQSPVTPDPATAGPVTARGNPPSGNVRVDGTQCSNAPDAAQNANSWISPTPATDAVPAVPPVPGTSLITGVSLVVLRLVAAVGGLAVIVALFHQTMKEA